MSCSCLRLTFPSRPNATVADVHADSVKSAKKMSNELTNNLVTSHRAVNLVQCLGIRAHAERLDRRRIGSERDQARVTT